MLLERMSWMMVEEHLRRDRRLVFVLGSTEEHGFLSLATDTLVPWEIARRASEEESAILAPPLQYGFCHWALDYPGTISVRTDTYLALVRDLIASAVRSGFERILLFNGHGGNRGAREAAIEAIVDEPDIRVWFHSWWELPQTAALLANHGKVDHANWSENFPFNRVGPVPDKSLELVERRYRQSAARWRERFPDGVLGGKYQLSDTVMERVLGTAVKEVVGILQEMRD